MNQPRKETRTREPPAFWQKQPHALGPDAVQNRRDYIMPITRRLAMLAPLLAVAGCSAPGSNLPRIEEVPRSEYRLGASDQVRVTVFNDPRLTGDFRVSDAGTLALPLIGTVRALGRITPEVERAIEAEMKTKNLFRDPNVAVEVLNYRPIFVLGMVERGGQFPYQPGMTALTAVAVAGGFNYRAIRDYVSITRIGRDNKPMEFRAARESLVQPGDVVTVFERRF